MGKGRWPNLAKLVEEGSLTRMKSVLPTISSVAWSTFMTGKNPAKHGIFGFVDRRPNSYEVFIPTSLNMTSKTLWEILSEKGKQVLVMNVPVTYPPRKVNGYLVSGFLAPKLEVATYPASLASRLQNEGYEIDIDPWRARENLDHLYPDLMRVFEARTEGFLKLYRERKWDFAIVHIMETDRLYHFMWEHMEGGHPKYSKQFMDFFDALDRFIGTVGEEVSDDVTLMVMSDHGFCTLKKEIYLNKFLELLFKKNTLLSLGRRSKEGSYGVYHLSNDPSDGENDVCKYADGFCNFKGKFFAV